MAQSVERRSRKAQVPGPIPGLGFNYYYFLPYNGIKASLSETAVFGNIRVTRGGYSCVYKAPKKVKMPKSIKNELVKNLTGAIRKVVNQTY